MAAYHTDIFEQTFKNIDDILHKDAGCGSELDYVEQTSWIHFLKYLVDLEKDRATAAELTRKTYIPIIEKKFQWNTWTTPKAMDGKLDYYLVFVKLVESGVVELDLDKLSILLTNKYKSLEVAMEFFGDVANISRLFIEFQEHLYSSHVA